MSTTANTATAAKLPDGIEIFRAGTRTADDGTVHTITRADLISAAAAYSATLHEAPLTVGHPANNLPAYGWVAGLQVDGDVLKINPHQVEPQFAEMVAAGRFKKRSAGFYSPPDPTNPKPGTWYLRHVAFLGAQPPAVKGLKDIAFAESAQAVNFSEALDGTADGAHITTITTDPHEEITMTPEDIKALQDKVAAAEKAQADLATQLGAAAAKAQAAETQVANFAEQATRQRHDANVSFCEAQVQAGRLLPKEKAKTVAVLDVLSVVQPVEFSEGDKSEKVSIAQFVMDRISSGKPLVEFGEHAVSTGGVVLTRQEGDTDAQLDAKARAYMAQHKVNYAEAISAVVSAATFTA